MELIITFLYILFIVSAIVLVVVILLQEGKGGGLTGALGVSGQQTFGVGASGINKFTGWTGAIFLVTALGIHFCTRLESERTLVPEFDKTEKILPPPGGENAGGAPGGTAGGTTGSAPAPTGGTSAPAGGTTPPASPTPPDQPKK
jgi:preprotein translocase subunit SecG